MTRTTGRGSHRGRGGEGTTPNATRSSLPMRFESSTVTRNAQRPDAARLSFLTLVACVVGKGRVNIEVTSEIIGKLLYGTHSRRYLYNAVMKSVA